MKVVLGIHLDGKRSGKKHNAFNSLFLGPSGFLSQLELYLGLSARRPSKLQRVIHFRKALKQLDNGRRFYSRSMRVDDFGVASELLEWRDELSLRGWNGTFHTTPPSGKLTDLTDVEAVLRDTDFPPGNGERLAAVADALQRLRTPIASIELLEPLERHPLRWQQVIGFFPWRLRKSFESPGAPVGSALHALQRRLLLPESSLAPGDEKSDDSLNVVTADTPLTAASHIAQELHSKRGDLLLIDGGEGGILDKVLEAEGYPRQALQDDDRNRPVLQLLPILLRLRRTPLDVEALLDFLTLPEQLSPLDPVLSERLARAVAGSPGTGGRAWLKILTEYRDGNGAAAREAVDELHRWIDGDRAGHEEPLPLRELKACAEKVRDFFSRKKHESEPVDVRALCSIGFDQASVFGAAADTLLEQGERELGAYQIDQLLAQASSGLKSPEQREAGSVPDTSHPGTVGEPFSHVIWWWAAAPPVEKGAPWSTGERLFLDNEGIPFPSEEQALAWQATDWLRPLLAAKKSCLLVLPPEGEERHPLWLTISSLMPALSVTRIEEGFGRPEEGTKALIPRRDLPGKRAFWEIPPGITHTGRTFSPTSLETFITAPSRWFLDHVLRIAPSGVLELSTGPLLYGTLAHRMIEQLVALMQEKADGIVGFDRWFETAFDELVRKEGAILLMPGKSAELENFRFRLRRAVERLVPVLREYGSGGVKAEHRLEGSLNGFPMQGRADLLLFGRDNALSVIDMKWGRLNDRRRSMQQGMHIQLLAYAAMVNETYECWPLLAYFIVKNTRLLASGGERSLSGEVTRKPDDEPSDVLWRRVTRSFEWRMEQLQQGILAVESAVEDDDPRLLPPADGLRLTPRDDRYDPCRFLEGWEATA